MTVSLAHGVKGRGQVTQLLQRGDVADVAGLRRLDYEWNGREHRGSHGELLGSVADVEDDGAAPRRLADRAVVEHLVKRAVLVHLDLEPGQLKELSRLCRRQPLR